MGIYLLSTDRWVAHVSSFEFIVSLISIIIIILSRPVSYSLKFVLVELFSFHLDVPVQPRSHVPPGNAKGQAVVEIISPELVIGAQPHAASISRIFFSYH